MLVPKRVRRSLLATVLTASALGLACGSASSAQLALGESTFRAVWTPARFIVLGFAINCELTLEGSFHSTTIAKTEGSLIGYVTRAESDSCSTGAMSVLTETLPWHVQYVSFTGTLPDISTVTTQIIGMSVALNFLGTVCLGRSEEGAPAVMIADRGEGGAISDVRWDESTSIALTGPGGCESLHARLGGTSSSATGQGNAEAIALTLVDEAP